MPTIGTWRTCTTHGLCLLLGTKRVLAPLRTLARFRAGDTEPSPHLAQRHALEHFCDPRAGGTRRAVRQIVGRKESVRDDFVTGHRCTVLAKRAHDKHRNMIAPRGALVEE